MSYLRVTSPVRYRYTRVTLCSFWNFRPFEKSPRWV